MSGQKEKSGGKRDGAGRHLKYGEPMKKITIEIPESKVKEVKEFVRKMKDKILLSIKNEIK